MQIAGIIAEYHPFHNGHAWQIAQARALGAEKILIAMSSGAVQRGGIPLLPDSVRVRAALEAGADMVLAIPAPYAASGAENFAAAGVRILAAAGCDTLVFGAESADAAGVAAAAQALCSAEYQAALRTALDDGAKNFAVARQTALAQVCPAAVQLVQSPNDNLGVEYARANLMQKAGLTLCPLPRQGVGHHDGAEGCFASASHLRQLWYRQGADAIKPYVPEYAFALYQKAAADGLGLEPSKADIAVLSRLRMQAPQGFAQVRGISEGLDFALEKAVRTAVCVEDICDKLTTSRYPTARIRRLIWDAALGWTNELNQPVPYLHILGAHRSAMGMLTNSALPAEVSLAKLARKNALCRQIAQAQADAVDLGALCRSNAAPMGTAYTQMSVILP